MKNSCETVVSSSCVPCTARVDFAWMSAAAAHTASPPGSPSGTSDVLPEETTSPSATTNVASHPIHDMLAKITTYAQSEAEMSLEDYRLLEAMNLAAAAQYSGMADYASGMMSFAEHLQCKSNEILPQMAQIDILEGQLVELEDAVGQLDGYSRRLEAKFQALQDT